MVQRKQHMNIYTVKRGDSVFSVARQFGVPASRIITDNFLSNPARLTIGQELVILFPTRTHTIRGGETLMSVANEYGISLNAIYRNNPVLNGIDTVFPGQVLNISYEAPPLGKIITNGYAYPYINQTVLRRTLPYLTYLSVFSYGITDSGMLIEPDGNPEELVRTAHEYSTIPLLVLTSLNSKGNFSSELVRRILSDKALSEEVSDNVAATVKNSGYGGVDIDFEYISGELSDAYVSFIGLIKSKLEDMPVFVSLAPKYSADQEGLLYEGHDYKSVGEVATRTFLMTYEWGYTYGPPMAVAPLDRVKRVVEYAKSEIPSEKLLLGVPNYGYDWALPYVRGKSRAESISNEEAVERARARGAEIIFDETAQAPYYNYYDRPTSFEDAVRHEVWFENARSIDSTVRLANEYSLSGCGVWNIMNYFPAMWAVINSLCNIEKY